MKVSSQCVKIILVYLTGNLYDLLPLLEIVGQYYADKLSLPSEFFGEKSLVDLSELCN